MKVKKKVLIVDDDPNLINELKAVLKKENEYHILAHSFCCEDAFEQIEHSLPDIIVTGIKINDECGMEFSKHIHKLRPHIKIIAICHNINSDLISDIKESGMVGCILRSGSKNILPIALKEISEGKNYFTHDVG